MSDGGVTAGHSDDVIGGLSTLPNISVDIGSDVDGGVVRESQQDNTSSSSSISDTSSAQSKLSVLFYFFS